MSVLRRAVLVVCAAIVLGGCGGDGDEGSVPAGTVVLDDYEFRPRDVQASRGETLTVRNEGGIAHNLTIERGSQRLAGTESFLRGDSERVRIDLPPGRYRMICTVPGHEGLGMTGTLTVR